MGRGCWSFTVESVESSVAESQGTLASLAVVGEPDGRYSASGVLIKLSEYFRYGVREVWVVYPLEEQIYVYRSPASVRVLTRSDLLESPDFLPGFQLPLEQLF